MVDPLTKLVLKSNDEQKKYMAHTAGITGGTAMYNAWQRVFDTPPNIFHPQNLMNIILVIMLLIVGIQMLYWSYRIHGYRN